MSAKIKEALTEHYGMRCPSFDPNCRCCKAWSELDELTNRIELQQSRIKELNEAGAALIKEAAALREAAKGAADAIDEVLNGASETGRSNLAAAAILIDAALAGTENG